MKLTRSFRARLISAAAARRLGTAVSLLVLAACSTTVKQSIGPVEPVSSPTTLSLKGELHVAEAALASGNLDLATTIYMQIVRSHPDSVPGLTGLGDTLYAEGDHTRANVYYDKALSLEPQALPAMTGKARVAIRQRRLDDAIAGYRRVLALSPNDPMAAAGLGTALDMQGHHDEAQSVLRSALQTNPGDPRLETDLGLSLVLGGKPREGVNVLLDVTRFPAAPAEARQNLALAYGMLGNDDAAEEILNADLPKKSTQDNLRYYAMQRMRLAKAQANPPGTGKPAFSTEQKAQ
ncbi:tetratricopeptide repeat protein [Paraburkholderia lycopersici]|uniref:Flp pilus assembly protein TadD, contains TPR repeats n=1 Tax=Paraburkholderia lycopersici TaxID=416944 RepID=A0A1G6W0M0_9BURK|nr:tetratricopeptide repeat protein [Paraburkholderia lycopersici]SDD59324.1 Flp pilus assembly protein TadD, contains TPR repeats [Paraburkholderia lycopersici]